MRIEAYARVEYEHNPLAEVVCQLKFEKIGEFTNHQKTTFQDNFSKLGYEKYREEVTFGISFQVGPVGILPTNPASPQVHIQHFETPDGVWRVSICSEFIALTCTHYIRWGEFLPRILAARDLFFGTYTSTKPLRIGLRYRDLVEREALGLVGVPWHELIQPFLLGPLSPNALADKQMPAESEVLNFLSQSLLRLENADLLLQSSVVSSVDGQRRAFLIDADFFNDGDLEINLFLDSDALTSRLNALHSNAGALFRRGITKRLHDALRPRT